MAIEQTATVIIQPDMRFATSFLSTEYRDRAVPGEILADKTSGEIFFKRPIDNKIISFSQNKALLKDIALDLRILLANTPSFVYNSQSENGFCVSTNYDPVIINDETLLNYMTTSVVPSEAASLNKLEFKASGESNGFFCRVATRDADKAVVEFLSKYYNNFFTGYEGENVEYLAEASKLSADERWANFNAVIEYTLVATKDEYVRTYEIRDYIRLNESSAIVFPDSINLEFVNGIDYFNIKIKSIVPEKIQFMCEHASEFDSDFLAAYNKLMFPDNRILAGEINIVHFIDSANDYVLLGNETIVAFVDIPHMNHFMYKMSLIGGQAVITKIARPPDTDWGVGKLWLERVRDFTMGAEIINTSSETTFNDLNIIISKKQAANGSDIVPIESARPSDYAFEYIRDGMN